jgi:hypothetical protein
MGTVIKTQTELERLCAYWQSALRLNDWVIQVSLSHRMTTNDTLSDVKWNPPDLEANIILLHPDDWPEAFDVYEQDHRDMEHDLLHELLHIHLREWDVDDDDDDVGEVREHMPKEVAINMIAGALLAEHRSGRKR